MVINEDDYLEHFGVKGMKWGVRRTNRIQKILDRHQRVANGTASKADRLLAANRFVFTKKGAKRTLQRGANNQAKMAAGKMKVSHALIRAGGIKIQNLNYGVKGDANAKLDSGQKAAVGVLAGVGAMKLVSAMARR